jgi:hypothetical protein
MKRVCRHDPDLSGWKYGRITVLKPAYVKDRQRFYDCECTCGNKFVANVCKINRPLISCGCHKKNPLRDEEYGLHIYDERALESPRFVRVAENETKQDRSE